MVEVMWWWLWEQPPSCLTHAPSFTCYRGSGWGKPLIHRLLSQAHTDTQQHTHSLSHTHKHTHMQWSHILIKQLRWSRENTLISVCLSASPSLACCYLQGPNVWRYLHTHLMANNLSCLPGPSFFSQAPAALTGPTACLQRVSPNMLFSPVTQREETER